MSIHSALSRSIKNVCAKGRVLRCFWLFLAHNQRLWRVESAVWMVSYGNIVSVRIRRSGVVRFYRWSINDGVRPLLWTKPTEHDGSRHGLRRVSCYLYTFESCKIHVIKRVRTRKISSRKHRNFKTRFRLIHDKIFVKHGANVRCLVAVLLESKREWISANLRRSFCSM